MYSVHTKEGSNLTLTLDVPELDDFVPYMGWTEADVKLVQSDVYVNKMHDAFSKLKYKFNLHVKIESEESIALDPSKRGRNALSKAADNMVVDKNAINAFFFSQITGAFNFIPLTPWMAAHRMDHMIESTSVAGYNGFPDLRIKAAKQVVEFFKTISKTEYRISLNGSSGLGCLDDSVNHLTSANLWQAVSTFRTARLVMDIPTSMDLTADVLAQYITTGHITFLRYVDLQERMNLIESKFTYPMSGDGTPDHVHHLQLKAAARRNAHEILVGIVKNKTAQEFDKEITKLETSLNTIYDELVSSMVGPTIFRF